MTVGMSQAWFKIGDRPCRQYNAPSFEESHCYLLLFTLHPGHHSLPQRITPPLQAFLARALDSTPLQSQLTLSAPANGDLRLGCAAGA